MKSILLISVVLIFTIVSAAFSSEINRARLAWSAIQCSTYAEIAKDSSEQERLFKLGYTTGKSFVEDLMNKKISEVEINDAPIGVRWLLAGPNSDFVMGRIFESASNNAYDNVIKRDDNGLPIADPLKWIADDELKISIAKKKYLFENCSIIK